LCELTQISCNPHNGSLDTFNDSLIFETKKNQVHNEQLLKKQKALKNRNKVLVFLFDGMQSAKFEEFLSDNPNSTFNQIINDGVKAEYMIPSFSTLTFSNHYTLATGFFFFLEEFYLKINLFKV
jgi:predicted AlkP superfamily pyrophosphatase or phosphodiesterase